MIVDNLRIDYINFDKDVMLIGWSANIGFGVLTINWQEKKDYCNYHFAIETECLGEDFYKQVMDKAFEYMLNSFKIIE